jgi:mannose-1-phosphate guanylyltransferase
MRTAGVVLAAGVGSRLWPLTHHTAKPLLPVLNEPLLGRLLDQLVHAGVDEVFVNLHHHAEQVAQYLGGRTDIGVLTHRREAELTGPAGALAVFADELSGFDAVLVVSGDVLTTDPLGALLTQHLELGASLTFGVTRVRGARRYGVLDVDEKGRVVRAREKPDVPDHEEHCISAGMYCLSPELVRSITEWLPRHGTLDYARHLAPILLGSGGVVAARYLTGYWRDIGTPQALLEANLEAVDRQAQLSGGNADFPAARAVVHPAARVAGDARLGGRVVIGAGAVVESGACIAETVLLPGARVPRGAVVLGGLLGAAGPAGPA